MEKGAELNYDVIYIAEVKRIKEKLTKKELANICNINYNYYVNCATGLDTPSAKMKDSLTKYVETKTTDVYKNVFSIRKEEDKPHKSLDINEDEVDNIINNLVNSGVFAD